MHTSARSLTDDPGSSTDDPGFVVLDVMLRLHGIEPGAEQLGRWAACRPLGITEILHCARETDLGARVRKLTWKHLIEAPLPAIVVLRDGGFLLLGRVNSDQAVVVKPGASRPTLVTRAEFEAAWDGRLIVVKRRRAIAVRLRRLLRAPSGYAGGLLRQLPRKVHGFYKHESAQQAVRAGANAGGTAVLVFADHARKLGRAVAKFNPEAGRRPEELAFLPAALEIVETPPSPIGRAVTFSIIGTFVVALLWASFGTVDIVAVAPGKLIPSSRTKTIQPFETGVVRGIHVRDGTMVKSGDLLIELDPTMSGAELGRLKSDLLAARFDIARLTAALIGKNDPLAAFKAPDETQSTLVETHRRLLVSQTAEQNAKLAAIDRQVKQKEAERATSKATIEKLKATLKPLQQRVEIREQLVEKQLVSKLTYLTEMQELVGQQQEILVQTSRYSEADAAIAALMVTRTRTVAEYERMLLEERSKAEQKAAGLAQDVIKAEQRKNLQRLTAPIDGMVQQLQVHTIGGVVTPAQSLMLVVPTESRLEVEAMISNRDIGFVQVDQDVAIKVDTFSFTRYGMLHGKILSISQDAIARNKPPERLAEAAGAETASSEPKGQELVYAARIAIDRTHIDIENTRVNLSAGMAVTGEVKTGSRSLISYLLSPLVRYKQESMRER
jgi:hemolysin D